MQAHYFVICFIYEAPALATKQGVSQAGQLHLVSEISEIHWELHSCQS